MNESQLESETTQPPDPSVSGESTVGSDASQAPDVGQTEYVSTPHQDQRQSHESHGERTEGRLHAATIWVPFVERLFSLVVPVFIASIFVPFGSVIFFVVCFAALPSAVFHILRFITFRYSVTGTELVVNSGVVFRRERRIPFARVQELEIRRGVIHRIFDLAKLEITTAGSDAQEASLNVLSRRAAEALKETIRGNSSLPTDEPDGQNDVTGVTEEAPDYVCQLTSRELLLGGLTSRLVASFGAVIAAIVYFQLFVGIGGRWWGNVEQDIDDRVLRRLPGGNVPDQLEEKLDSFLPDFGPFNFAVDFFFDDTLPKSLSLVMLGLAGSVVAYVIRYHGFRLTRRDNLLTTSYGLLTHHRSGLQRDRIQALKLEEGLLRRYFKLASIRVDSAGDRTKIDESKKRDVLVPVASKTMAQEIARQAIPGLTNLDPEWRRISPKAVIRGSKKGWLLMLLAMLQTYGVAGWYCLIWLPAIPLVYLLNYQWYRHTGYWLEEHYFLSRSGWLNQATVCLPVKNIQNVTVTQSPFDRRLGLATLSIDTAGQSNTGGGPVIRHLPITEARNIQRTLARHVADCEFTW